MTHVVSFGGGLNSTALLVGMAERQDKPDAILFADTGGEKPGTYEHIERMQDWCRAAELPEITVVRYHESKHASLEQECLNNGTLPSKAFGFAGCSVKWKRQPMDRWIRSWPPAQEAWERGERVQRLIGIHAGERHRGQIPECDRFTYRYPLIEWGWGTADCKAACERAGIPVPVKSACFFCPAMRKVEVLRLAKEHPELFQRAVEMEQNAQECGGLETVKGLGRHWTWEQLVKADSEQLRLFADDQSPLCDVCMDGGGVTYDQAQAVSLN